MKPADWNALELLAAFNPQAPEGERIASTPPAPHLFKASLNGASLANTTIDPAGFGAIALYAGAGEVRYSNVALKDLGVLVSTKETVSPYFTMQRINDYYYGWSAAVGDFNHDGLTDVTAGPFKGKEYVIELSSPVVLEEAGWSRTTFKPGDRVTVSVNPSRTGAPIGLCRQCTVTVNDVTRARAVE